MNVELVAIERPDGLLVERLLDAGLRVLALHPNQVAAARPRFRVSGGKSDRFDAFVICELARTDHHRFRVLEPDSDQTKALRALTRAREDLVQTRTALSNQLCAELERFWPEPIGLFKDLDSPISLAFLKRYPTPQDAKSLAEKRIGRLPCWPPTRGMGRCASATASSAARWRSSSTAPTSSHRRCSAPGGPTRFRRDRLPRRRNRTSTTHRRPTTTDRPSYIPAALRSQRLPSRGAVRANRKAGLSTLRTRPPRSYVCTARRPTTVVRAPRSAPLAHSTQRR